MADARIADLVSPATLARIDDFSLLARIVVEGFISGLHRSLYHGFGSEFFQYRSYVPGDDLKYVDWKVLGRQDKFYTKVFQEETNMNCCIVLDASASMDYALAPSATARYGIFCHARSRSQRSICHACTGELDAPCLTLGGQPGAAALDSGGVVHGAMLVAHA